MAQRQFRSDDTSTWTDRFGTGADGALTISADTTASSIAGYANTTFSGTQDATSGTAGSGTGFSAGDLILIHQSRNGGDGAGVWELNKISSVGGGTDWTLSYALCNDYATTAQVYRLIQHSAITIDSTKTLTGVAWNETTGGIIALLSNTSITVTGNITVSSKGYTTTQGPSGDNTTAYAGEGTSGAEVQQTTANGNGGGGTRKVSGSLADGAGGGGNGTAGSNGGSAGQSSVPGTGGSTAGAAALTTMVFGGGGGSSAGSAPRTGGLGGGIILLIGKTITVTGTVVAGGANGSASNNADSGGSGAGAGGSVLFKGQNLTLGATLVTASGGTGGTSGNGSTGGNGGNGRIHADYSTSISGSTTPTLDSSADTVFADGVAGGYFHMSV